MQNESVGMDSLLRSCFYKQIKKSKSKGFVQEFPHRCRTLFACKAPEFHSTWHMEYQLYFIVFALNFTPKATNRRHWRLSAPKG